MNEVKARAHEQSVKFQYLLTLVVNILLIGHGFVGGWASPNIILLQSDDSPLPSGKITMDEASWIASLICIGGLIGSICSGFITSMFGRKIPLILLTVPAILSCLLIWFAQNVYYSYAARLLAGYVAGGVYTIIPPFLAEICNDRVRGVLGSTLVLFCNLGILLAFTFGTYFDFYMTPKFVIVMTILCAILLFLFPESSTVLLKRNQISLAEESIRFYQNLKNNSDFELLQAEMTKLKSTVKGENSGKSSDNSFKLSDLSTGAGRKAMMIGIVLAMINQLSGCFAMLQYTATIFKEAGSSMSPNMSSIVVGLLQLVGSYVATLLVERSGRKFLFIVSSVGIALGLITLGVYMMLKTSGVSVESVNFIPIVSFSFVIFIANWAVLNLPFLVISELMPENLKDFGQSFCMVVLWVCSFITIKYLPLLTESLGMHGTMFLFSGACLSAATFIIIFMPETKGKSYEEIMAVLR